jgi:hypothetical protein
MSKPDEYQKKLRYFEEVVLPFSGDECLTWPFDRNNYGYGRLTIAGKRVVVSREVCRRVHGEPPAKGMDAAHSCGRGHLGCVNPRHLSWKTRAANVADTVEHGTSNRGERCASAKLTREQVAEVIRLKGTVTQAQLAARFGVHPGTISKVQLRTRWRWLDVAA